jgi:hypothetical protein
MIFHKVQNLNLDRDHIGGVKEMILVAKVMAPFVTPRSRMIPMIDGALRAKTMEISNGATAIIFVADDGSKSEFALNSDLLRASMTEYDIPELEFQGSWQETFQMFRIFLDGLEVRLPTATR